MLKIRRSWDCLQQGDPYTGETISLYWDPPGYWLGCNVLVGLYMTTHKSLWCQALRKILLIFKSRLRTVMTQVVLPFSHGKLESNKVNNIAVDGLATHRTRAPSQYKGVFSCIGIPIMLRRSRNHLIFIMEIALLTDKMSLYWDDNRIIVSNGISLGTRE